MLLAIESGIKLYKFTIVTRVLFFPLVLKRFHDVDHYISLLVQIPKHETVKTAENKITLLIYLKHCLELVKPLQQSILVTSTNPLLKTFHQVVGIHAEIIIQSKMPIVMIIRA